MAGISCAPGKVCSQATVRVRIDFTPARQATFQGHIIDQLPGFTGHETLKEHGLVHMNGRIYSPKYARFLSADPTVPYPTRWYSYNRYMYVGGNPASRYDPSGFTDLYADGQCPSCNEPPIVVTAPTPPVQSFDQYWTNQATNSAITQEIPVRTSETRGYLGDIASGSQGFFEGLYLYARHQNRLLGGAGLADEVQSNSVEHILLGEAFELAMHANRSAVEEGYSKLSDNLLIIGGRQSTSFAVGALLGGGGFGPSLGTIAGMGDVYYSIEIIASDARIYVTTVDISRPILPQLPSHMRVRVGDDLTGVVNNFIQGR